MRPERRLSGRNKRETWIASPFRSALGVWGRSPQLRSNTAILAGTAVNPGGLGGAPPIEKQPSYPGGTRGKPRGLGATAPNSKSRAATSFSTAVLFELGGR